MNLRTPLLGLGMLCLTTSLACKDKGETGPLLVIAPTSLAFGEVPVDGSSDLLLTIDNAGSTSIDLLSVSLTDGDAGDWNVSWAGSTTLSAGESLDVTVTFAPEEEAEAIGELTVRTSLDDPNRLVPMSGSGGPSQTDADEDGFSPATGDCDDDRSDVYPGAEELCDGRDNNCDGTIPDDELDADGDGVRVCQDDCDDNDATRYPGNREVCDAPNTGVDNDCDGVVQDDLDEDGDGYSLCDDDCDDDEAASFPGNPEICDFVDNDCNGLEDDLDNDGDGFSACESGQDCDDDDSSAYPVMLDASAEGGGDGSVAAPYNDLDSALAGLDEVCRTVLMRAGVYEAEVNWTDGEVTLAGGELDPSEVVLTTPEGSTGRVLDVDAGGEVTLTNLTVTGSAADADGGALRASNAGLILQGVVLEGNSSAGDGGAIAVSSGTLAMVDCTLMDNRASDDGGAVAAVSSTVQDVGSVYVNNSGARGGAIVWEAVSGDLTDGTLQGNIATVEGGALWIVGGGGLTLARLDLWQNQSSGPGGALVISDLGDSNSVLTNLWVEGNVAADEGGGIAINGSRSALVLVNSDLLANTAGGNGGGVYLGATDATDTWLWSNIIAWNGGSNGVFATDGGGASVAYNTAYNNTSGTDFSVAASEDAGFNESADPYFSAYDPSSDPDEQDLSLGSGSPAIDSGPRGMDGPSAISTWNDLDGSRNDRGLTGGQEASP